MSWIREGELNLLERISANILKVSLVSCIYKYFFVCTSRFLISYQAVFVTH